MKLYLLKYSCCLVIIMLLTHNLTAKYDNAIYQPNVKTMRIYVEGNELSYPIIDLYGNTKIHFEFDLIEDNARNYVYQIIHCNANWEQSDLFSDEFMDGFNENAINDYAFSANTRIKYVHYSLSLPNDDVQLKVSGNYIIRVIESGDSENTVATARFVIYEPLLNVKAQVLAAKSSVYSGSGQEVRLSVDHNELDIADPFSDIKILITQNNRPDRVLKDLKPVFVRNKELVYSFSGEIILPGGNEFRMFSSKNLHILGENINDIQFADSMYHVQLRLDERRSYKRYFTQEDMNGGYVVYVDDNFDYHISADYNWVYFYLPFEKPYLDGKVFLYGEFNNWTGYDEYELNYNFETEMYEGVFLLKQGVYNYAYVYENNFLGVIDEIAIEGSHFETENDYLIYVYYKGFDDNYDRLVGYQVVNSKYQSY